MGASRSSADLFKYDMDYCAGTELAGADEAGRGCLAGPIVAAAVVFDYSQMDVGRFEPLLGTLDDSKRMTAARREQLFPRIIGAASRFSIVVASNHTIDAEGLHKTNLRILGDSLLRLSPCPNLALIDGYSLADSPLSHKSLKKGDSISACVAAASVIAKVSRDRIMRQLDSRYPQYNFAGHKGYATLEHRSAIANHDFCDLHRRSFNTGPLPAKDRGS